MANLWTQKILQNTTNQLCDFRLAVSSGCSLRRRLFAADSRCARKQPLRAENSRCAQQTAAVRGKQRLLTVVSSCEKSTVAVKQRQRLRTDAGCSLFAAAVELLNPTNISKIRRSNKRFRNGEFLFLWLKNKAINMNQSMK